MNNWFFDKLTKLIDGKFSFNNNSFITINITKNSHNSPIVLDDKNKVLNVDLKQFDDKQKEQFKEITSKSIDEGNYLLENNSFDILEKLYEFNKGNDFSKHLSFFNGKINDDDYSALELSFFLRNLMVNHNPTNIYDYKKNISDRFGKRGGHIANLCTAGYFEELLIPIGKTSEDDFKYYYDLIVKREALTLFIHRDLKKSEIISIIKNKIKSAKLYGLQVLYIHSRGKRNNRTIRSCLDDFNKNHFKLDVGEKVILEYDILVLKITIK